MFDRRLVQYFDWPLLGITAVLVAVGLLTLYSAVTAGPPTAQKTFYLLDPSHEALNCPTRKQIPNRLTHRHLSPGGVLYSDSVVHQRRFCH